MASKKTVTLHNVASLGPDRLAAILVDLAEADAEVKRRLRLELAAQVGGDSIAAEIGKRITALRKARSFVDWQKRAGLRKTPRPTTGDDRRSGRSDAHRLGAGFDVAVHGACRTSDQSRRSCFILIIIDGAAV
jgi:hypothetical protein